jgi:hypothetical protein
MSLYEVTGARMVSQGFVWCPRGSYGSLGCANGVSIDRMGIPGY